MARLVSLSVLLALIIFLGITFFHLIAPFLLPLFMAGMLTIICQPMYRYFLNRTSNRPRLAAGVTTAAILASVLVPLLVATVIAGLQFFVLAQSEFVNRDWHAAYERFRGEGIDQLVANADPYFPGSLDADEVRSEFDRLQAELGNSSRLLLQELANRTFMVVASTFGLLGTFVSLLIALMMFVIALYFFFADGPALLEASEELIPVHVPYQREMRQQFATAVRSVVTATFFAALGQGLATAVVLWLVGMGHFFTFFLVATVMALIPLAGTWLVWGPCAVWLAYQGHWGAATFLAAFGLLVIGTLDNVIRTYVLNTDTKLHPLLAFVSVLGALQVMGLWGVFVGPIVASCLHALVKIFNHELQEFSKEKFHAFEVVPQSNGGQAAGADSAEAGGTSADDAKPQESQQPAAAESESAANSAEPSPPAEKSAQPQPEPSEKPQ